MGYIAWAPPSSRGYTRTKSKEISTLHLVRASRVIHTDRFINAATFLQPDHALVASEVNTVRHQHHLGLKGYDAIDVGRNMMTSKPLDSDTQSRGVDIIG